MPGHFARLLFTVRPGPKARFGASTVEGLGELPEAPVRRALDIDPGAPYSTADVARAQQSVLDLGTFASVSVVPDLTVPGPGAGVVPLRVTVQPQKLRAVLVGGGD